MKSLRTCQYEKIGRVQALHCSWLDVGRPAKLKADELAAPKPGVLLKMLGAHAPAAPNAGALPAPKAGVLAPPKLKAELLAAPKAGAEAALPPKPGVLKPPNKDGVLPPWLCPAETTLCSTSKPCMERE